MKAMILILSVWVSGAASAKEYVITQKDKQFSQDAITLAPGDTIVFKNMDGTAHNVFSVAPAMKFNLGIQKPGVQSEHKFETAGEGEVRCAIHPQMKIKVTVK